MKQLKKFETGVDVNAVECDVCDASVTVKESDGDSLCAYIPDARNVSAACGGGTLYIHQKKRGPFAGKQSVYVCVPAHTVPDISVKGKRFNLEISGGIYGSIFINATGGSVYLSACAAESAEILGGEIDVKISGCTIKSGAYIKIEKGNALTENSFASRCEYRVGCGNIGFADLKCKECFAETGKGSVNANICGSEKQFNCSLYSKGGSPEKVEKTYPDALGSVMIYTGEGNVSLDFDCPDTPEDIEKTTSPKENI